MRQRIIVNDENIDIYYNTKMHNKEWDEEETIMKKIIQIQCPDLSFNKQVQVYLPYDCQNRELEVGDTLRRLIDQLFDPHLQFQIFYFNPRCEHYQYAGIHPFVPAINLGQDFIELMHVTVKIRPIGRPTPVQSKQEKKKRGQQKTIQQVLKIVSKWRQISRKQPKISLQQAAKEIGLSRYSLDSYYSQIKIASQIGFDFKANMKQKIGVLRRFVKASSPRRKLSKQQEFIDEVLRPESESEEQEEEQE